MAIDNQFGKGIGLAAGFDLGAQKPLDSRVAVNTIAERDAHITENRAYEGMLVYVAEANMTYQLVKGEEEGQLIWKEFGFNQADFDGAFADSIENVDNRLKAVEEDLAQGGDIENRIAQAESDIDGLQGLVGQPADGENVASGLHAAVNAAQAKADQGVADAAAEKQRAEGEEAKIRQELENAVADLQAEIDADVLVEKNRAQGQEAAIRQELANEKAALQAEIDADVKVEKERAEGKEAELLAAINKEVEDRGKAIQDLANRHDEEMEAAEGRIATLEALHDGENSVENQIANAKQEALDAVAAEEQRAEGQEAAIRQKLANEKLALQGEIDADVKAEADRAKAVEAGHEGRIAANETFIAAQPAIDAEQDRRIKALEDDKPLKEAAIKSAQDAADAAQADVDAIEGRLDNEGGLVDRIEANEANIAKLDGAVTVEGSVKKQIKDAVDAVNADADLLEARVKANEDKLAVVQGADTVEGSIAKAKKDAKAYADQQIAALVDSAPEAMNTLNELANAIKGNKNIYDAYIEAHATDMANAIAEALGQAANTAAQKDAALKAELQAEIDADVKVVADALANEKDVAKEGSLAKKIADEAARAQGVENGLAGRIAANEAFVAAQPEKDQAQDDKIAALEAKFTGENSVDAKIQKVADDLAAHNTAAETKNNNQDQAIQAAQTAADNAQAAADKAQGEVDAVEERMNTAEDEIDALQGFMNGHSHDALQQGINNNAAAIEAEIKVDGNRDKAIAAALVPYSTTEQMKTLVGNVVNSLALSMENNEMILKLGGVDGIALTSTKLDMVTDDDIDAIIAGLDQE